MNRSLWLREAQTVSWARQLTWEFSEVIILSMCSPVHFSWFSVTITIYIQYSIQTVFFLCECALLIQSFPPLLLPVEILATLQAQPKSCSQHEFSASPLNCTFLFTFFLPFSCLCVSYFLCYSQAFKGLKHVHFALNPSWHITLGVLNVRWPISNSWELHVAYISQPHASHFLTLRFWVSWYGSSSDFGEGEGQAKLLW